MKTKWLYPAIPIVTLLLIVVLFAGCTQPQRKPEQAPVTPLPQTGMMGQGDPATMMRNHPEMMRNAMSAHENRQEMVKMMSDPEMRKAMADIMADPAMKDTFISLVKEPRLAPIARDALKQ